jgi:hypothetical protein
MGSIRRTLGGFTVAVAIAAGLVLMPVSVHAKQVKVSDSTTSFCDTLGAAIAYIEATYDGDLEAALVAPLKRAQDYYCQE